MWRSLHSVIALGSLVLVLVISLSGAFLALAPVTDAFAPTVQQPGGLSVAEVLGAIDRVFDEPDRLERLPSGAVVLTVLGESGPERHLVDIRTGASLGRYGDDQTTMLIKELHRSFLLGNTGRLAAGGTALAMAILCATGLVLLLRRQGGWRGLFSPIRGRAFERLHAASGRLSLLPLLFMAVTGFYLTLVTFGAISNGQEVPPAIPESLAELDPVSPADLHGLQAIPFGATRSVVYPIPGDWFDVYSVATNAGHVFVDQFTGDVLSEEPLRPAQIGLEWMKALHTGEGIAPLAAFLGLSVLSVPVFALSGVAIWIGGWRRAGGRAHRNVASRLADAVVLVGSENGSTWGFAAHLAQQLTRAGRKVHLGSLNSFSAYPRANIVLVLTATYGDGGPPKSAQGFLQALGRLRDAPPWRYAVLGFGDVSFPNYCRFGADVDAALAARAPAALPFASIDRESAQSFGRWGKDLGTALGLDLDLNYVPPRPQTLTAILAERLIYGEATATPTLMLRFDTPPGLPVLRAGDLVGVVPPGTSVARFYSPAPGREDSRLEICVRLLEGGHASGFLHGLAIGDTVEMFVRGNPGFYPPRRPIILIGAGTGIAPFAGMIRANARRSEISLYWGGRHPGSDFLYRDEIEAWLADGRLSHFAAAFSRSGDKLYVQDRVRQDAGMLAAKIRAGATVMVCGSIEMSTGVRQAVDDMLAGTGLSTAVLKTRRRYLEEIY